MSDYPRTPTKLSDFEKQIVKKGIADLTDVKVGLDKLVASAASYKVGEVLAFLRTFVTILALFVLSAPAQAAETITVQNCRYGEQRTDGVLACVQPTQIYTGGAPIPLPTFIRDGISVTDQPLGLRVTPGGEFKMAGQSWNGLGNWLYEGGAWRIAGPSYGVNPVLFDYANVLFAGAPQYGSQGLRFFGTAPLPACTGNATKTLCTGDNTYADNVRRLGQWTEIGDVVVGQSGYSCIAIYQGIRRVLDLGFCVEIHMTRSGELLAISYHLEDLNVRRFRLLAASELNSFPIEATTLPPVTPPVDPPIPPAEQPPVLPLDIFEALQRERLKYPTPLGDKGGALINAVAVNFPGWGLESKGGGNNCPQPVTLIRVGCDIIRGPGNWGYDVLGDQENAGVVLRATGGPADPARFVVAVVVPGTPPVDPGTPVDDIPALKRRIALLEAQVVSLQQELDETKAALVSEQDAVDELERKLHIAELEIIRLKNLPPPTCKVTGGPAFLRGLFSCEVIQP